MFIHSVVQSSSQTLRAHPCSIGFHYRKQGLPWWLSGKKSACQCRRLGFDPWVRKICWSGKWQPTPVFLPRKSHGQRSLVGYSPWGHKELVMMAGWHHWLDGRESEWTPGVGDGQGGLACCDSWGRKESDRTEWLNWTELSMHTQKADPQKRRLPLSASYCFGRASPQALGT